MIKLALAIGFMAVFGLVAIAVIWILDRKSRTIQNTQSKNNKNKKV